MVVYLESIFQLCKAIGMSKKRQRFTTILLATMQISTSTTHHSQQLPMCWFSNSSCFELCVVWVVRRVVLKSPKFLYVYLIFCVVIQNLREKDKSISKKNTWHPCQTISLFEIRGVFCQLKFLNTKASFNVDLKRDLCSEVSSPTIYKKYFGKKEKYFWKVVNFYSFFVIG